MMDKLRNWLKSRSPAAGSAAPDKFEKVGLKLSPRTIEKAAKQRVQQIVEAEPTLAGKIEDAGLGKNVLIRNKYVREDTGTHETLKILDDSIVDSGEESGIDPYNTGRFDRSQNWNNRFRK